MQRVAITRRQFSGQLWVALVVPLLSNGFDSEGNVIEKNAMQITLERSGGFTGLPLTITVDTATLPPEQATQLRHLVEAANFFRLQATTSMPVQPDCFEYAVAVQDGDRKHIITFAEAAVPEQLRPLLNWLIETAQKRLG